jgi:hypothetical protein
VSSGFEQGKLCGREMRVRAADLSIRIHASSLRYLGVHHHAILK